MSESKRAGASWLRVFKNALAAFLNTQQEETGIKKALRTSGAVLKRTVYLVFDYWLTALQAILAVWLYKNVPLVEFELLVSIFLLLWLFEIVCAIAFILQWKLTGIDLTLSEDWRRAVDVVSDESKSAGNVTYWLTITKAVIWDGPEEIIIFCNQELNYKQAAIILLCVTGFQAAFWGTSFIGAYEFVVQPVLDWLS